MPLALGGHPDALSRCLLWEVKRTLRRRTPMSAFDPKRTLRGRGMLLCNLVPTPFASVLQLRHAKVDRTKLWRGLGKGDTWPLSHFI